MELSMGRHDIGEHTRHSQHISHPWHHAHAHAHPHSHHGWVVHHHELHLDLIRCHGNCGHLDSWHMQSLHLQKESKLAFMGKGVLLGCFNGINDQLLYMFKITYTLHLITHI